MSSVSPTLKDVSDRLANDPSQDDLVAAIEALANEAQQAKEERERLRDENEELRDENERLRDELESVRERTGRQFAEVRSRVTDVEDDVEADETDDEPVSDGPTPTPDGVSQPMQKPVTPLEKVTRMDEPTADSSLTRNQDRARAVFRDVLDYTQSVPKGRAIATPDLRRVLTAFRDGGSACYKTVARVVDFLTEMGKDDVWTKQRMNGDTVVVFSEDICKRRAAYQNQASADDGVVSGNRVAD
jgi:ElaB/YqjD/DUF883 family membrane-anchored ribosome-binding protein